MKANRPPGATKLLDYAGWTEDGQQTVEVPAVVQHQPGGDGCDQVDDLMTARVYGLPTSSAQRFPDIVASGGVLTLLRGPTPLSSKQTAFSRCLLQHQVQIALIRQGLTLQALERKALATQLRMLHV